MATQVCTIFFNGVQVKVSNKIPSLTSHDASLSRRTRGGEAGVARGEVAAARGGCEAARPTPDSQHRDDDHLLLFGNPSSSPLLSPNPRFLACRRRCCRWSAIHAPRTLELALERRHEARSWWWVSCVRVCVAAASI
jgi:hypothetical protein